MGFEELRFLTSDRGSVMSHSFYEKYKGNAGTSAPKYMQLGEAILSAIKDGYWKPGDKLPAEMEIARTTPFSLGTVQKALRMLVDQSVIERKQGHGTFVLEAIAAPWHFRFSSETRDSFLPLYSRVLRRRIVRRGDRWGALLSPEAGELIRIDRIMHAGHRYIAYNVFYISLKRYPAFWEKAIGELDSANLKILLQREYNENITRASNFIRMVVLPSKICTALQLKRGSQGILLETVASSGGLNPVYLSELYVPPGTSRLFISDFPNAPEFWP